MVNQKDVPPPKFGKTALELLDPKNAPPKSVSEKYGLQFGLGLVAGSIQLITNWTTRRPMYAGLYRYPIYFIAGAAAAELYMNHRRNYFAERDAVFRHYIQLHPEDFPPPERKRFGEVLLEWIPIR